MPLAFEAGDVALDAVFGVAGQVGELQADAPLADAGSRLAGRDVADRGPEEHS